MNISISRHQIHDGVVRLCVTGEVDLATSDLLAVTIHDAITAGQVQRLVVDLDKVTFLDPAGVAALVAGHRLAAEHGVTYLVTQPPDQVGPTADITGVPSALQQRRDRQRDLDGGGPAQDPDLRSWTGSHRGTGLHAW